MTDKTLPEDSQPLTAMAYFQESLRAWGEFSQKTSRLMMGQMQKGYTPFPSPHFNPSEDEPLSAELLRAVSDLNLQHWQNTARFLEGLPSWMRTPRYSNGTALVDWFDQMQRAHRPDGLDAADPVIPPQSSVRPMLLASPEGRADDLTRIKGIGKKLSGLLNELGVFHFTQIANWSPAEAAWIDDYLAFKGRVAREDWIGQAQVFSVNGLGSTALH